MSHLSNPHHPGARAPHPVYLKVSGMSGSEFVVLSERTHQDGCDTAAMLRELEEGEQRLDQAAPLFKQGRKRELHSTANEVLHLARRYQARRFRQPKAFLLEAYAQKCLGRFDASAAAVERGLQLFPAEPGLLMQKAWQLASTRQLEAALACLQQAEANGLDADPRLKKSRLAFVTQFVAPRPKAEPIEVEAKLERDLTKAIDKGDRNNLLYVGCRAFDLGFQALATRAWDACFVAEGPRAANFLSVWQRGPEQVRSLLDFYGRPLFAEVIESLAVGAA